MKKRTKSLGEIAEKPGNRTFNDISKKPLTSKNLEMLIEVAKNEAQTKRTLVRVIVMHSIASWVLVISIVVSTNSISNPVIIRNISWIIGPQVTLLKGVISHYFKNKR